MKTEQNDWGLISFFAILLGGSYLSEMLRIFKGKTHYLKAMIDDQASTSRGKKRKREDDDISLWLIEGRKLLMAAELMLQQIGEFRGFLERASFIKSVHVVGCQMAKLERKADELFRHGWSYDPDLRLGCFIPVRDLIGQVAVKAMIKLEALMLDYKVGRIVIHGVKGIGKTALMKYLYNFVLRLGDMVDNVFWVTSPEKFSVKHLQDAIASAIKCVLPSTDDLGERATVLSKALTKLGKSILFLDDVPAADFTLEQVGIPAAEFTLEPVGIPATDGKTGCKVVSNTSTTLDCGLLDTFVAVKVDPLSEEEAYELIVHEAGINKASVSSLDGILKSLMEKCNGVPGKIVDIAMDMCGITDLHEWRNALYETENLVVLVDETDTKKLKKEGPLFSSSVSSTVDH